MPLRVHSGFTWTLDGSRDANMYQHPKKKILGRHGLDKTLDDCIDDDFSSIGRLRRSITSDAYIYSHD